MAKIEFDNSSLGKKTIAGTMKSILPEIEEAIDNGANYEEIIAAMVAQNILHVSLKTFRKTLYRLRKTANGKVASNGKSKAVILNEGLNVFDERAEAKTSAKILSKSELRIQKANRYMEECSNPHLKRLLEKKRGNVI